MAGSGLPPAGPWVDKWLSADRFGTYVRECAGNRARGLALYEWNALVGQAMQRDLGHVEVALRNAYDRAVRDRWQRDVHWLLDPQSPVHKPLMRRGVDVNARTRAAVVDAVRRAGGETQPPGKVIAELSFGFWRYLTSRAHEKTWWVPYLHRAYPPRTDRRKVDRTVAELAALRNRIAHLEPIFKQDLRRAQSSLLTIAELLHPDLADYLRITSVVADWLDLRPEPDR